MDFFETVKQRHSIRAFKSLPVEPDKLQQILDCINHAPSAGNLQAYEVLVVREEKTREALFLAALQQQAVRQAPVLIIFCEHAARSAEQYGRRGKELFALQDATIACSFAVLAATALGLGSLWIGAFHPASVAKILNLPKPLRPIAILAIGYANASPLPTGRRSLNELIHWDHY
jgi:nitroreductase